MLRRQRCCLIYEEYKTLNRHWGEWHHQNCRITVFPSKNTNLYNHSEMRLCGCWGIQLRISNTPLEQKKRKERKKKPKLDALKRLRGITLSQGCTAQCQERHSYLWVLPQEKVRACEWAPVFPSCTGCCERDPTFFSSIQNTEMCCETGWKEVVRRTTNRALCGH